jgi:hypothetical protein
MDFASLPMDFASLPMEFASLPMEFASLPMDFASLPMDFASLPMDFASLPMEFASLPMEFASLPMDFASLPMEFAAYLLPSNRQGSSIALVVLVRIYLFMFFFPKSLIQYSLRHLMQPPILATHFSLLETCRSPGGKWCAAS